MSEFKFACPVCGQHITAGSGTSGGQIECPTCFQKIVVPPAPASQDTKLIMAASQVSKPRPASTDAAWQQGDRRASAPHTSVLAIIAWGVLFCAAGAALFIFRDRLLQLVHPPPPAVTHIPPPPAAAPVAPRTVYPVPTDITWTLDLTKAVVPETPAAGSIHGYGFRCERAVLRGGLLFLNQGKAPSWDLVMSLGLVARQGEELSGKTVEVGPDQPSAPRVVLRWKDDQRKTVTKSFKAGYALKVAFGQAANKHLPGKIYLCLPDAEKSFVAGTFIADIRNPPPPKPSTPKAPKPAS